MREMIKKVNVFFGSLKDPDRDFSERLFILMTMVSITGSGLVLIGDIAIGENLIEILTLVAVIILGPIVTVISVRKKKIRTGAIINAVFIVFAILPITFITGGGLTGGSSLWVAVAYLYIGVVLTGRIRTVFLVLMTLVVSGEYTLAYFFSDLVPVHNRDKWFLDSIISVFLVGFLVFIMVWFQNRLFMTENEKAKKQAKEIEELNRSQNRFFSSMSHEIRTPINTIIGLNEMILREDVSEKINEDAANIQAAGKMLLSLINDILDMSKCESGQMQINPVNYNPGNMLSDVVNMMWIKAHEKNLEFTVDVSPELPAGLKGDEIKLKQILINVINNAIKYTEEGSVKLQIQCEELYENKVNVIYTVSDTGSGIKKENIPYLFTAFKRVDEEKNRYIEGTGLGLSIVKQFVDLMGGRITVNSVYTKGSTFIIEIPQIVVVSDVIGEIDLTDRKNGYYNYTRSFEAPNARILVVDDTRPNLMVVEKLLRQTKVIVDTAMSGKEALQKTLDQEYNVIFMDHLMPEMDGIECLHKIRNQTGGFNRESMIVALTANAGPDVKELYEKEGFDGYLLKPISGEALEAELLRLLPKDLVVITGSNEELARESMSWIREHRKKAPVLITTDSVADIPAAMAEELGIVTIPHMIRTGDGLFRDGLEIATRGLLTYMENKPFEPVKTVPPSVNDFEAFFSNMLERAYNVIHISVSGKVEHSGYPNAKEAAGNFDNVFVVDSGHLSSGQGFVAIKAAGLALSGMEPEDIIEKLDQAREHVHTSFIVDSMEYLARQGHIGRKASGITRSLLIRPVISLKHGRMRLSNLYFGDGQRAWRRYISSVFRVQGKINRKVLFITYVGLDGLELKRIEKMVRERMEFEKICFQCASPAIAVNCGPGTFGLLFTTEY